jgi:hypothetical protein
MKLVTKTDRMYRSYNEIDDPRPVKLRAQQCRIPFEE